MIPIVLRTAAETDIGFILDSFLKGAQYPIYSNMLPPLYRKRYKPIILNLIKTSKILIACLPSDANTIVAYVVYDFMDTIPIIHYIHTRSMFQKQGIAKYLLTQINPNFGNSVTVVSHLPNPGGGAAKWTKTFHQCREQYHLTYDPFLTTEGTK